MNSASSLSYYFVDYYEDTIIDQGQEEVGYILPPGFNREEDVLIFDDKEYMVMGVDYDLKSKTAIINVFTI